VKGEGAPETPRCFVGGVAALPHDESVWQCRFAANVLLLREAGTRRRAGRQGGRVVSEAQRRGEVPAIFFAWLLW